MARRRFQEGYVFKRGKKRKVWVARWREMLIGDDGKLKFIRKAEVIGSVSELTKSDAKQKLVEKLDGKQKSGEVDTTVTFSKFVKQWWKPSILPTYKPSTRKQAQLALDNYLVPKFGEYRLSDISNVDVQAFFGTLLEKLKQAADVFPRSQITIEGHTDSYGGDENNLALSRRRAEAVGAFLTNELQVPAVRISAVGYGETQPIANNDTEQGRERNRRIDVIIEPQLESAPQ